MAERCNKQHSTLSFVIGESVSLRIPSIDRASSDLSCLPCVVVDIVGGGQSLYRLRYDIANQLYYFCVLLVNSASNVFNCRCQHGVLNVCYTAGELERYNGSVICAVENWQNEPFISLREAA